MILNEFKPVLIVIAILSAVLLAVVAMYKRKVKSELLNSEFADEEKIRKVLHKYDVLGDVFLVVGLILMFFSPSKYSSTVLIATLFCITLTSVVSIFRMTRK